MTQQLLLKSEIKTEIDIAWVRKKARDLAAFMKLDSTDQIRLATAVSEIARNAYQYAGGGSVHFSIDQENEKISITIEIRDRGAGITQLKDILLGYYVSKSGMGVGIRGAKKLVDAMLIETDPLKGTSIILKKIIPSRLELLTQAEMKFITESFMASNDSDPIAEIQKQNREILLTMGELQEKKDDLTKLNRKLEDNNRGIVALYAELDEKAQNLRVANESKTSFLADMTHEFRSPLNSIINISQFLLEDAIDEKASERIQQIEFIIKASTELSGLVNDLLDIAKIEAGKIQIRATEFPVTALISTMRGMMAPFAAKQLKLSLNFLEIQKPFEMYADEAKVTQILRNLISNAIKYTQEGEITVSSELTVNERVLFTVKDSGIGIPLHHLDEIFTEFTQLDNSLQNFNKGTGLGLPLSLKLARLLGGSLRVESKLGEGSTFFLDLPLRYSGPEVAEYKSHPLTNNTDHQLPIPYQRKKVLMVDDDEVSRLQTSRMLKGLPVEFRQARNGQEAWEMSQSFKPDLIILDLIMPRTDGKDFLKEFMAQHVHCQIPVLLYTSKELDKTERQYFQSITKSIIFKDASCTENVRTAVEFFIS